MDILVAGASGAVGRFLLPLLVEAGHRVTGMTRHAANLDVLESAGVQPMLVDALDRDSVFRVVREAKPEAVIHQLTSLSAMNLADNARIRIEGTRNLVDAALASGVRRMIAQSISWIYEPGDGVAVEETPLDSEAPEPRSTTIKGVVSLEQAVAEMPEHVILRYGYFYGPGTRYARDGAIAEQVEQGRLAAADGVSSFIHVADAARAASLALHWPSGVVHIVDDEPAPSKVWLPVYAGALGAPMPEVRDGSGRGERGASNAKARLQYGWEPLYPTWRDGFRSGLG